MPNITATEGLLRSVTVNPPSNAEIKRALKQLKLKVQTASPLKLVKSGPKSCKSHVTPSFPSDLGNGEASIEMEQCLSCQAA